MYKYKINELLDQLTRLEYKYAMHNIPSILGISSNTWLNYKHIKISEKLDIPYGKVRLIECLFGIGTGELTNEIFQQKEIRDICKGM